jgi:multidrug efflux pump subunit AcrB
MCAWRRPAVLTFDIAFDRLPSPLWLDDGSVANTVSAALGGRSAGQIFEGDRRFDIVVRLPADQRSNLDLLGAADAGGGRRFGAFARTGAIPLLKG